MKTLLQRGNMKVKLQSLVIVTGLLALSISAQAQFVSSAASNSITVSGDAEIKVVPDEVILILGVETSDKNLKIAKSLNDERIKKVLALAKDYGISSQHIQTDYISIQPEYRDYRVTGELLGYVVRKTIVIRLKDIPKFENLLSDALEAGVSYVHGIEFRTTELRKYRDQARAMAIKAAQEKATALANEVGRKAGKALSIGETAYGSWSGYNAWWGNRWGGGVAQNVTQNAGGLSPGDAGSLAPGQITVRATVSVTFALE